MIFAVQQFKVILCSLKAWSRPTMYWNLF